MFKIFRSWRQWLTGVGSDDHVEDAVNTPVVEMDLQRGLDDCAVAFNKFFNNDIPSAQRMMQRWRYTSLYHAHGNMIFQLIPALLTLDPMIMTNARAALDGTIALYNNERRSSLITQRISSIVKWPNYAAYSDQQAHLELINAECQLIVACLDIIQCEDNYKGGLLRASMYIRSAHNLYKICSKLLEVKQWDNDLSRCHYYSGVKLGEATLHILTSMLPPRLITLLEYLGLTANKEVALKILLEASESPGMRSVICRIMLLAYHLNISKFASMPINLDAAAKVLNSSLQIYPNSIWFMLFKGRLTRLEGNLVESYLTYQIVLKTHNIWAQIHHLAYWEIMWSEAICMNWASSARYAELLAQKSNWSKTIYMYLEAAMILQLRNQATRDQISMAKNLLMEGPEHRQRIMGRFLPLEKMAQHRCHKFHVRGYLVLPAIEMMYLWNLFPALAKNRNYSDEILKIIQRAHVDVNYDAFAINRHDEELRRVDVDDLALVFLLKGALLAAMGEYKYALIYLKSVIGLKFQLTEKHLVPFAIVESAKCIFMVGDPIVAVNMLNEVRDQYSNYPLESLLKFKLRLLLAHIKSYLYRRLQN